MAERYGPRPRARGVHLSEEGLCNIGRVSDLDAEGTDLENGVHSGSDAGEEIDRKVPIGVRSGISPDPEEFRIILGRRCRGRVL